MDFKQRAKIVGYILGGMFVLGAIASPFTNKTSNLTPAQKLEITSDCIQNPDAWRCR